MGITAEVTIVVAGSRAATGFESGQQGIRQTMAKAKTCEQASNKIEATNLRVTFERLNLGEKERNLPTYRPNSCLLFSRIKVL